MADRFGRKTSIILNSAPYLFGYFIILCSHLARTGVVFKVLLILGRFISGIGMGWTYVMAGVSVSIRGLT